MATATTNQASELFGQAAKSFESAIQAGLKLQEESVKVVSGMLNDLGSTQNWRMQTQAVMSEVVATSQKNMDEALQVMNENAKTSMDLLQKTFEAPPADAKEIQSRTQEVWETTLSILRRNAEAASRTNARLIETWTEMAKKASGEHLERMAEIATKAAAVGAGA